MKMRQDLLTYYMYSVTKKIKFNEISFSILDLTVIKIEFSSQNIKLYNYLSIKDCNIECQHLISLMYMCIFV